MMPRPEAVWTVMALGAVVCIAAAGFMVGPKCGLWCLGLALCWLVRVGTGRRD